MPLTAAKTQLELRITGCTQAYWQIRAASAALLHFSETSTWRNFALSFENLPHLGCVPPPAPQPIHEALVEIKKYVGNGRAVTEHFMSAISHLEAFVAAALIHKSLSTDGTLGQLLTKAEHAYSLVPTPEIEALREIRERRNMLIHHNGFAQQRYIAVCTPASLPSNLRSPVLNQTLHIDDEYFAYACDRIVEYSRQFA